MTGALFFLPLPSRERAEVRGKKPDNHLTNQPASSPINRNPAIHQ